MAYALQFKYGDLDVNTATWPDASIDALIKKGLTHVLGNEVAALVTSRKKGYLEENPDDESVPEDVVAQWTAELRQEKLEALETGVSKSRAGGPRLAPIDSEMKKIARAKVFDVLRARNIAIPSKGGDGAIIKIRDVEYTISALIDRRLKAEGEDIRKKAEKIIRDREREARFAAEKVAEAGTDAGIEDLGL